MTARAPSSVREVVENGLCIGCGLCEALAMERWKMRMTAEGRLRPALIGPPGQDGAILAACPGAVVEATAEPDAKMDPTWGAYLHMGEAWAGDADVRYLAATGGVLTALGQHLLNSGQAAFVLHCAADPKRPMRTRWVMSETADQVLERAGSRYGPSDTLAGLEIALARNEPFAVIAKLCDATAIRARAQADPRIDQLIVAVLVMVCGGASELGKSQAVLADHEIAEDDVTLFRYRGHGNPGPTRIEARGHGPVELSYLDMWADEGSWRLQSRCKICPDAIGEAADIAAADIWPGGAPTGDDAGFNGVIMRTRVGQSLFEDAVANGSLVRGKDHKPRDYDDFQPHQVRKKHAVAARLRGLVEAGRPVFAHSGLRIDTLDSNDPAEEAGTLKRARDGRFDEPFPGETT